MKQRDLIKKFVEKGWYFSKHGGNHDIYTDGKNKEAIPRHTEINERLAKELIKRWGL